HGGQFVSFATVASYLPLAVVSQASSSCDDPSFSELSACLIWHLKTAPASFDAALPTPSSHLSVVLSGAMKPVSSPPSVFPANATLPVNRMPSAADSVRRMLSPPCALRSRRGSGPCPADTPVRSLASNEIRPASNEPGAVDRHLRLADSLRQTFLRRSRPTDLVETSHSVRQVSSGGAGRRIHP